MFLCTWLEAGKSHLRVNELVELVTRGRQSKILECRDPDHGLYELVKPKVGIVQPEAPLLFLLR